MRVSSPPNEISAESVSPSSSLPQRKPWDPQKPPLKTRLLRLFLVLLVLALLTLSAIHTFSRTEPADLAFEPVASSPKLSPLRTGTNWAGTLKVTHLKGSGPIQSGITDISAVIGFQSDGSPALTIYEGKEPRPGTVPLFFSPVRLEEKQIIPTIAFNSFIFRLSLLEEDVDALTFTLADGKLSSEGYVYNDGEQKAALSFWLYPAD